MCFSSAFINIYTTKERNNDGNVIFNYSLRIFHLQLYDIWLEPSEITVDVWIVAVVVVLVVVVVVVVVVEAAVFLGLTHGVWGGFTFHHRILLYLF